MTKREIKLKVENGYFDIDIESGDFANEDGFDTNIWVSLFTDARADESQVIAPENRRGWMGNGVLIRPIGGHLWLAEQRRLNQETLNEVMDYIRKSLQWMTIDGITLNVEVSGRIIPRKGLDINVLITAKDGITSDHYIELWRFTGAD